MVPVFNQMASSNLICILTTRRIPLARRLSPRRCLQVSVAISDLLMKLYGYPLTSLHSQIRSMSTFPRRCKLCLLNTSKHHGCIGTAHGISRRRSWIDLVKVVIIGNFTYRFESFVVNQSRTGSVLHRCQISHTDLSRTLAANPCRVAKLRFYVKVLVARFWRPGTALDMKALNEIDILHGSQSASAELHCSWYSHSHL